MAEAVIKRPKGWWVPYLYVAPAVALFCCFIAYPILRAFQLSFTSYEFLRPERSEFVGLDNYIEIFRDSRALRGFGNTLFFTAIYVPLATALPLLVAFLVDRMKRCHTVFRTLNFIPVVVSVAVISVMWVYLYNPSYGLLNKLLAIFGIETNHNWLGESSTAMVSIVAMCVWHQIGFNMLLYLVGLARIPNELYEAARIDGAGPVREFVHITLPLLRPTIFLVFLLGLIGSLKVFGQMYIMTAGGPGDATLSYVQYLYSVAFKYGYMRFGYAAALGYALAVVIFCVSLISFRFRKSGAEEAA